MMSGIRGKDTRPEMALRRALHARGARYRLHARDLPGRPDMVLPRYRAAIFVNGCFWHRHAGCRYCTTPATRPEFWAAKFEANVRRDASSLALLAGAGWRTAVVWECALRGDGLSVAVDQVVTWLMSGGSTTIIEPAKKGASQGSDKA